MTTNMTKKPANNTTKIFSLLGAAILMTCMFSTFAVQAQDTSNVIADTSDSSAKTYHYVSCQSNDYKQLSLIQVDCPHWGKGGYDHAKDLKSCQNTYGPEVAQAFTMGTCIKY